MELTEISKPPKWAKDYQQVTTRTQHYTIIWNRRIWKFDSEAEGLQFAQYWKLIEAN